ncbi:palmitoyltransferase ZDHHC18, putative [Entamoeba invadens IP1]|uniref:Palmitoyltransferase n=1 Tax=Entamoeba invadens TaxID=33085 RepID=S0B0K2_ENTIV|nr:palmitoyltransferase ZDHHC18, putative [Entamoeba invadens IP1]ELP90657.1 palmitoyltransferase ZDHHC18, putative [Entamoeba invadens IP1]BAN41290.1 palmitoyltransferase ZDHHC18, putative [Entamoeba invadens]|eukprot:XP_004257428.1 palmitoyltransferase ZDHHC18, putative [Entamoeba invadens IP1]
MIEDDGKPSLPTPPYYDYHDKLSKKQIEMEEWGMRCLFKFKKYVILYAVLLILFGTSLVVYTVYYKLDMFTTHPLYCILSVLIVFIMSIRLAVPIPSSFSQENYIPDCSEEEKEDAKRRASLAQKYGKKLIETIYSARYCVYCNAFMPPRTYHCMLCKKCIDCRDHHCSWLCTCVGKNNLRSFWQLLVSIFLLSLISSMNILIFWYQILFIKNPWNTFSFFTFVMYYIYMMITCISCSLFACMGAMLYIHTRDLLYGKTGVEIGESNTRELAGEIVPPHKIKFQNLTAVLGPNVLYWFLPLPFKQVN